MENNKIILNRKIKQLYNSLNKELFNSINYTLAPLKGLTILPDKTVDLEIDSANFSRIIELAKLLDIDFLDINCVNIDQGFFKVTTLKKLKILELTDVCFTNNQDIKYIGKIKSLARLTIYDVDCSIFNDNYTLKLPNLETLSIFGKETNLSNLSFLSKKYVPKLKEIDVSSTEISDISAIINLKEILKAVFCNECSKLPKKQILEIRLLMPDVFFPPINLLK